MMTCDVDRLVAFTPRTRADLDYGIQVIGLGLAGRRDEAREALRHMVPPGSSLHTRETWRNYLEAWLDYRLDDMRAGHQALRSLKIMDDPEAIFQMGRLLCDIGDVDDVPFVKYPAAVIYLDLVGCIGLSVLSDA